MLLEEKYSVEQKARIRWACRRGMLELDVIIMPFFEHCFDSLTEQDQQHFVQWLQADDPDLFSWLMGYSQSDDPTLQDITNKVKEYNRRQLR